MSRNIVIVNATQVVVSETHPEGVFSVVGGYPKLFDSQNYNGDIEATMKAAKSDYFSRLSAFYAGAASRIMATVTLEMASGQQILRESLGAFPDMTPPEPEPEPEAEA